jgi:hypothetical protein
MIRTRVTLWNMPLVLLEVVPETAPLVARAAAEAYEIDPQELGVPVPPSSERIAQMTMDERLAHPREVALNVSVGQNVRARFSTYGVAGWMFLPVFEAALQADPADDNLLRRCCSFVESALAGDQLVAEGVEMMVIENFGMDNTRRALPYAGSKFRAALQAFKWVS